MKAQVLGSGTLGVKARNCRPDKLNLPEAR
jgi:hypothetical protein